MTIKVIIRYDPTKIRDVLSIFSVLVYNKKFYKDKSNICVASCFIDDICFTNRDETIKSMFNRRGVISVILEMFDKTNNYYEVRSYNNRGLTITKHEDLLSDLDQLNSELQLIRKPAQHVTKDHTKNIVTKIFIIILIILLLLYLIIK